MSTIKIFDLRPVGSHLFHDSENFLDELTVQDISALHGGNCVENQGILVSQVTQTVQYSIITKSSINSDILNHDTFPDI